MNAINAINATRPTGAGPKLFISYRRADSASIAGRIYDRLAAYFGRDALFKDVDNIPIGANFEQVIASVVTQSAIVLALIGPSWATISNEHGRRLDDPQDVVRLEVEASLRRGIPVIPVLVEDAAMPDLATLPPSLRPLFAYGAMQVRNNPWFDSDMSQLATTVGRWLPLRSVAAAPPVAAAPTVRAAPASGAYSGQQSAPGIPGIPGAPARAPRRRRRWFTSPVGLSAVAVLIAAVALLSLAGAGLVGAGPFGHLGAATTPLATAPTQPSPTATPAEHVVLSAALTSPQAGWESDSGCIFARDGYHTMAPAGYYGACLSPSSYTNFVVKARAHALPGTKYADYVLYFRYTDNNDFDYVHFSFKLLPSLPPTPVVAPTPTPDYSTWATWDAFIHSNGTGTDVANGSTPAVQVTGDGANTLEVIADGPTCTVLVNGQQLGSFQDTFNKAGKIGLGTSAGNSGPNTVIFTSISIATLAS